MSTSSYAIDQPLSVKQRAARNLMKGLFTRLQHGSLTIVENFSGEKRVAERFGSAPYGSPGDSQDGLHATIEVKHPGFYQRALSGGSVAIGEAYMEGWWDSPDLTTLVRLVAINLSMLDRLESRKSRLTSLREKLTHWLRRNTRSKARENIHAHYDLGNELYKLFLDKNMLYSSAIFYSRTETLEQAQINKMDRLCRQLALSPADHVLEIGSGWGAMAIYMAENYGCRVTTTTISGQQYDYALEQIRRRGLEKKITLLKKDYRDLQGVFDKLVSVEMIEAVGRAYLPTYIEKCRSLLKPGGLMALQSITIADQRFAAYSTRVDFIQKYIFPGGFLPSVTYLMQMFTRHSDLVAVNMLDIGLDYAKTLERWHAGFDDSVDKVRLLGYDERFIRMWRFYLSYCEGGFLAKRIGTVQLTLRRPE